MQLSKRLCKFSWLIVWTVIWVNIAHGGHVADHAQLPVDHVCHICQQSVDNPKVIQPEVAAVQQVSRLAFSSFTETNNTFQTFSLWPPLRAPPVYLQS